MFPFLYSPNKPVYYFLDFFTSWFRIWIQEAYLYADPFGSGSETLVFSQQNKEKFENNIKNSFAFTYYERVFYFVEATDHQPKNYEKSSEIIYNHKPECV